MIRPSRAADRFHRAGSSLVGPVSGDGSRRSQRRRGRRWKRQIQSDRM